MKNSKSKARWIWGFGEFELYHHLLVSTRRQEKGCDYPCMWYLSSPEKSMVFKKEFTAPFDTVLKIVTHSKGMVRIAGMLKPVNTDIKVPAGDHEIVVELFDLERFTSLYCDSEYLISDDTWICEACDSVERPVAYLDCYSSPEDDPAVFPFLYKEIKPVSSRTVNGGVLYDFGKETFARLFVEITAGKTVTLVYGESEEEALDENNAIIREKITSEDVMPRPGRAFRYIFMSSSDGSDVIFNAEYEYLPLKDKAYFRCDKPEISRIWDMCSYTFHLNSREFFLDGIKRDRWVWSGDAYQSFMVNRYLFADDAITERTIIALLGKPPYRRHINFINDYSAYLIMAIKEHLFESGNIDFVKKIYPSVKALYSFIISRLDENGYSVGLPGDWVFVDWGVLDKTGAICVEQILLWQVYLSMTYISSALGEEDVYSDKARKLENQIRKDYWDREKGAYIDSFSSGKRFTSRQTNVFAVLFGLADEKETSSIIKNVFENDDLPQITTPYFKLYELMALCKTGAVSKTQKYISEYWGGMLECGATTVWEAFDPSKHGAQHYEMYGSKYGKSLCHAWGSGPVFLLGRYCCGVKTEATGGSKFSVRPEPGVYNEFEAVVPVGKGTVSLKYSHGSIEVFADIDGGTLYYNGNAYQIEKNKTLKVTE